MGGWWGSDDTAGGGLEALACTLGSLKGGNLWGEEDGGSNHSSNPSSLSQ